jgi:hypothetical protein
MCLLWIRTGFYIPEDGILHSHLRENFKWLHVNEKWKGRNLEGNDDVVIKCFFLNLKRRSEGSSEYRRPDCLYFNVGSNPTSPDRKSE